MFSVIRGDVYWGKNRVRFVSHKYHVNDRLAIQMTTMDGEPLGMATVNVPDIPLAEDHVIIKSYNENEGLLEALELAELVDVAFPTKVGFQVGWVCVWKGVK